MKTARHATDNRNKVCDAGRATTGPDMKNAAQLRMTAFTVLLAFPLHR